MKIRFLNEMEGEFDDALAYYEKHASASVAEAFIHDVEDQFSILLQYPQIGSVVAKHFRILPLRRFPYSLIYRVSNEEIIIYALTHQRRKPKYWAGR